MSCVAWDGCIKLFTVAEGEIGELHIGFKSTLNSLYLKDLAAKTHRGLRGRSRRANPAASCYGKDPATGKRVSRPNKSDKLIIKDAPELRIIDNDLWQAVKALQTEASKRASPKPASSRENDTQAAKSGFWSNQRPKHLLTGLMRCGVCGGGYHKISATWPSLNPDRRFWYRPWPMACRHERSRMR